MGPGYRMGRAAKHRPTRRCGGQSASTIVRMTADVNGTEDGFADIVGHLDYPMFVVTTRAMGELSGCLVGFATQTGIDPVRFLVGISNKNHTYRVAQQATHLAVHVLGAGEHKTAALFGGRTGDDVDKFTRCAWREGPHGLPILDGAPAWFTGEILERVTLGDHVGFLLAPDRGELRDDAMRLLTFQDVSDIDPGHEA